MERQLRLLMFSSIMGWTIAFPVGMVYFLIHTMISYQTPSAATTLKWLVNYGLISGGIGGFSMTLGLRFLNEIRLLTTIGLTIGWAVSLAVGLIFGWLLIGQNIDSLLVGILIGMTVGGGLGGVLTGFVVQQRISANRQAVRRIAVGWTVSFLIGNGVAYGVFYVLSRIPNFFSFGLILVLAILGGAIAGAIGSRIMIQQIS